MDLENRIGEMHVSSSTSEDLVVYDVSLKVEDTWIEPEEYESAKELFRSYMAPKNRMVLLERKKVPETKEEDTPQEGEE